MTSLSGNVTPGSANGLGLAARFTAPRGLWLLPSGQALLVADTDSATLRHVQLNATGGALNVSTLSAVPGVTGYADGSALATKFNAPFTVAADATGTVAFVADRSNHRVRGVFVANGSSYTFLGSGSVGSANGVGVAATLNQPYSLTFDMRLGILYIGDAANGLIRSATVPGGTVRTVAGAAGVLAWADGPPSAARFRQMYGLAVPADASTRCGADCALVVADTNNHRIRAINLSSGAVWTLGGTGTAAFADGQGTAAAFNSPFAVAAPGAVAGGAIFVSDFLTTGCGQYCPRVQLFPSRGRARALSSPMVWALLRYSPTPRDLPCFPMVLFLWWADGKVRPLFMAFAASRAPRLPHR